MSEYRFVMITVALILGLGLSQLVRNVGQQIRNRSEIEFYPLQVFASCLIFCLMLMWIWVFSILIDAEWSLTTYLFATMSAVALAFCAELVSYDPDSEKSARQQYFESCKPLYLMMGLVLIFAVLNSVANVRYLNISEGSLWLLNGVRVGLTGLVVSLAFVRKPGYHWIALSGLFLIGVVTLSVTVPDLQLD
jgi:hypothetical protein